MSADEAILVGEAVLGVGLEVVCRTTERLPIDIPQWGALEKKMTESSTRIASHSKVR